MTEKPTIIVIGAGFTGAATAYDLAMRGCQVIVLERGEIASGTSGRTHGLLHSGARYVVNDPESAVECIEENAVLRQIAPQCIEPNTGLFIGLDESDLAYREDFIRAAEACRLPCEELTPTQALRLEPNLNPGLQAAFQVQDGTFDPLRLALVFAASAQAYGARFHVLCEVTGLMQDGQRRVTGVQVFDRRTNTKSELRADLVVNATGAWAGQIAKFADVRVPILPTAGVMVAYDGRLVQRSINRLNMPGDGDIAIPQRRMVVVGTTSFAAENLDCIPIYKDQVQMMLDRGSELIPGLRSSRVRGAYMSSRPLLDERGEDARSVSRTFKCFDHAETNGVANFITITGGKATTCRAMAEKTADIACHKLGITTPCATRSQSLKSYREFHYDYSD